MGSKRHFVGEGAVPEFDERAENSRQAAVEEEIEARHGSSEKGWNRNKRHYDTIMRHGTRGLARKILGDEARTQAKRCPATAAGAAVYAKPAL